MTGKPDDIQDDVWRETGMEFDKLYDAEPDLDGGCELGIREMAARMVLAERKRCAEVADVAADEQDVLAISADESNFAAYRQGERVAKDIASAILGQP